MTERVTLTPDDPAFWDAINANAAAKTARSEFERRAAPHVNRGWPVFPLMPKRKVPAIKGGGGFNGATTDHELISAWSKKYRAANVGIATGRTSGITVIDIDPRNGGDATLAKFEAEHGALPETPTAKTGNGGRHLFFSYVSGVGCSSDKIGSGIDVRSDGGYVVGAGSFIGPSDKGDGGSYTWVEGRSPEDVPLAEMPEWLVELLLPPRHPERPKTHSLSDLDADKLAQLEAALGHISADNRDYWRRVGQALYHALGTAGRARWDQWSATSDKFNPQDQERTWRSFARSAVTGLESIFALARQHGADLSAIALTARKTRGKSTSKTAEQGKAPHDDARWMPEPEKGKSRANVVAFLERAGIRLRHNAHTESAVIERDGIKRPLSDADIRRVAMELHGLGLDPPREFLVDALLDIARESTFHPVRDYLDGLTWDGVLRVDQWLAAYAKADDTLLHRAFGRKTLIGAVRRVRQPGCKLDTALTLIGPQGCRKSTAVRMLAGAEHYSDALHVGAVSKEVIELTNGAWIVELSELAGMRNREAEHVKHFLSRQSDRARLSYDRMTTDRPRQFVVIATTNEKQFLRDATGNRRFWPVEVGEVDIDALARDRDQLWAEAAHYEAQGEPLELPRELWADAAASQSERMVVDPWFELLDERLDGQSGHVAVTLLWRVLNIEGDRRNPSLAQRLNDVMARLGFEKRRLRRGRKREYAFTNDPKGDWIDVL